MGNVSINDGVFKSDYLEHAGWKLIVNDLDKSMFHLAFSENGSLDDTTLVSLYGKDLNIIISEDNGSKYQVNITNISDIQVVCGTKTKVTRNQKPLKELLIVGEVTLTPIIYTQKLHIETAIHHECNMNCEYCFQNKHIRKLELSEVEEYFDYLFQIVKPFGVADLQLMGGETIVRWDKFMVVWNLFTKYGLDVDNEIISVFTNAYEYSQDLSDFLTGDKRREVYVSCDSLNPLVDHRHVDKDNITNILKHYIDDGVHVYKILMNAVITKKNINSLTDTVTWMHDVVGLRNFCFKTENSLNVELIDTPYEKSPFMQNYNRQVTNLMEKYPDSRFFKNNNIAPTFTITALYRDGDRLQNFSHVCLSRSSDRSVNNIRIESDIPIHKRTITSERNQYMRLIDVHPKEVIEKYDKFADEVRDRKRTQTRI